MLTGAGLLLLFSNKLVSSWLVRPFEDRYPPIPELRGEAVPASLAACRHVVVLGSGNGNTPGRSDLGQLSNSAIARLTEAVRILRVLPEAKLVLSGPPIHDHPSHATVMARSALSLGIDGSRIILIEQVRDTEDESLAVSGRIGREPFALVTTAWHMPRAVALFRHAGLSPLPCPTDYLAHDDGEWRWNNLLWDVDSLARSTAAIRETLGYTWIWLRGRT
jgi:uncharacterized SAM-binding protein YcdF (DUF218 family)